MATHQNNVPGSDIARRIRQELMELENEEVDANGILLKPSQCYHFETDPPHVLFNTNCPASLKERIQIMLSKYLDRT